MKFTKRFRTQEEYDAFIANGGVRIPTISVIDNPLDFKVDNAQFPLYFYSETPVIVEEAGRPYAHFYVKPNVNIYDKLFYLLSYATEGENPDLPVELLDLCTFYIVDFAVAPNEKNENKLDYVGKSNPDFQYGDVILLEFEHTWKPINGYEFDYAEGAAGFLTSDGQIRVDIMVKKLN